MKKHSRHTSKFSTAPGPTQNKLLSKFNEAFAFHQKGRLVDAKVRYEEILKSSPEHSDSLHLLGLIEYQTGNPRRAVELINRAITFTPNNAAYYVNHGMALRSIGRFEDAVANYERALVLNTSLLEAHYNRANALGELGRLEEAVESYEKALSIKPDHAQAYYFRGNALRLLHRLEAAVHSYDKAISLQPDYIEAHYNKANALARLSQLDSAIKSYDKALSINPYFFEAQYERGNALKAQGDPEAALISYDKAISIKPDFTEAHFGRGMALKECNQLESALVCFDTAIKLNPNFAEALSNRGSLFKALGMRDAAISSYDQAIAIKPDYAEAIFNKALLLLQQGDFKSGWPLYESRWANPALGLRKRDYVQPLWSGKECLSGKTIFLYSEQGIGDTIQFSRYIKLVERLGATVLLEVPESLIGLFGSVAGVAELLHPGKPLPTFDYHCPLLSLPLAFNTDIDTIPATHRYLQSTPQKIAEWQAKLGEQLKPRIGLVWSGSCGHVNDRNRSIPLSLFVSALPSTCVYICLQKEVRDTDMSTLRDYPSIRYFGEELRDFNDTAALCTLVDLVISVDTSVAHLSATLGKPTWIMIPTDPDWRWLLDRENSPWYPTVKLYRQGIQNDWIPVLQKIFSTLSIKYSGQG